MKKGRNQMISLRMNTDSNDADCLELLESTPAQVKSLLHILEQRSRGISLNVNSDKTVFICFKQDGAILYIKWKSSEINKPFRIPR